MARGIHLFPSRTEKLSLATPMVLRNSGRVGSRRLWLKTPVHSLGWESFFVLLYLDLELNFYLYICNPNHGADRF